jgi:hypothetical protein
MKYKKMSLRRDEVCDEVPETILNIKNHSVPEAAFLLLSTPPPKSHLTSNPRTPNQVAVQL